MAQSGDERAWRTTLYIPPGEYEYKYIVDGVETVPDERKRSSDSGHGLVNVLGIHVEDDGKTDEARGEVDADRSTILHIRWLESNDYNGFDVIEEANNLSFKPDRYVVHKCSARRCCAT